LTSLALNSKKKEKHTNQDVIYWLALFRVSRQTIKESAGALLIHISLEKQGKK
jgi:hypothetical protein